MGNPSQGEKECVDEEEDPYRMTISQTVQARFTRGVVPIVMLLLAVELWIDMHFFTTMTIQQHAVFNIVSSLFIALIVAAVVIYVGRRVESRVHHAEQELRDKEHLLSEAQRLGHIGSWIWWMDGRISWSDEMYRIFGVSPDTFVPTLEAAVGLIHPDDQPAMGVWNADGMPRALRENVPVKLNFESSDRPARSGHFWATVTRSSTVKTS